MEIEKVDVFDRHGLHSWTEVHWNRVLQDTEGTRDLPAPFLDLYK